jgi:hypothetical protein
MYNFPKPNLSNGFPEPNLPAGDRYFTQQAFLPLLKAQSDIVMLCKRTIVTPANHDYGVPEQYGMSCRRLNAYISQNEMQTQIAGGGVMRDTTFTVVVVAASSRDPQFSPEEVTHDSFFYVDNSHGRINGRYLQGVLTRVVTDYNYPAAWFYALKETAETIDLPLKD